MSRAKAIDAVTELKETLTTTKPSFKVVVMPDFYLDYILTYPGKLEDLTASFVEVAERGGGNLLGWRHTVGRGGNASNVVAQVSKLGCQVVPIIETDELGKTVLQHFLKDVDLSHVRTTGTLSRTMSFETEHSGRRVNIMVSDPGSLSQFGPEKLAQEDKRLISEADFVCVLNWNQNLKGTDLADFFQAEDGIRDADVTGVQTCALPIYPAAAPTGAHWRSKRVMRATQPPPRRSFCK